MSLMESLLKTLRYNFINEALDFVGVHQERILQVSVRRIVSFKENYCHLLLNIAKLKFM